MARRDYGWFYQTAPDGMLMSASQYKRVDPKESPCWVFYGLKYLERVREPQGDAAGKGDAHHEELEMWVKLRRMPKHAAPLKALPHGAAPGVGEAEVPVFFFVEEVGFVGFIDLVYDWESDQPDTLMEGGIWMSSLFPGRAGKARPLGSTGHTVIHDWKFTGSLNNAMSSAELANDPAANMYAYEAFLGGAERVSCRWVYTQFEGSHTVREVWAEMYRPRVEAKLKEMVSATRVAWQKRRDHKRGLLKVLDEPCNTSHCFDFRRPCAYKSVQDPDRPHLFCVPKLTIKMPMPQGDSKMSEAFRSSLANFPGVQSAGAPAVPAKAPAVPAKAAPAVPPKAGAPAVPARGAPALPLSTKAPVVPTKSTDDVSDEEARRMVEEHLRAQGKDPAYASAPGPVVESGFVNPGRYAPTVPARSPEHAVELQGIKKPEPAEPVVDELTELTKEQLVALASAECPNADPKPSKRMREDTLRNMIRLARINRGGQASPIENNATPVAKDEFGVPASVKAEGTEVPDMKAAATVVAREVQAVMGDQILPRTQATDYVRSPQGQEAVSQQRAFAAAASRVLELFTIVDAANLKLQAEKNVRDWREIPYTGAADLNNAVYDLFGAGVLDAEVVVFDDHTPEGSALKSTLVGLARAGKFVLVRGDVL